MGSEGFQFLRAACFGAALRCTAHHDMPQKIPGARGLAPTSRKQRSSCPRRTEFIPSRHTAASCDGRNAAPSYGGESPQNSELYKNRLVKAALLWQVERKPFGGYRLRRSDPHGGRTARPGVVGGSPESAGTLNLRRPREAAVGRTGLVGDWPGRVGHWKPLPVPIPAAAGTNRRVHGWSALVLRGVQCESTTRSGGWSQCPAETR